ncbi:hypothetical protein D3C73_1146680 [compost metagenome]
MRDRAKGVYCTKCKVGSLIKMKNSLAGRSIRVDESYEVDTMIEVYRLANTSNFFSTSNANSRGATPQIAATIVPFVKASPILVKIG